MCEIETHLELIVQPVEGMPPDMLCRVVLVLIRRDVVKRLTHPWVSVSRKVYEVTHELAALTHNFDPWFGHALKENENGE
jgi:hypothetical protein